MPERNRFGPGPEELQRSIFLLTANTLLTEWPAGATSSTSGPGSPSDSSWDLVVDSGNRRACALLTARLEGANLPSDLANAAAAAMKRWVNLKDTSPDLPVVLEELHADPES